MVGISVMQVFYIESTGAVRGHIVGIVRIM